MTGNREQPWWDPNVPETYDASKAKLLRDSVLVLIERDVSFSIDAMMQGCDYAGGVRLETLVVTQDEEVGKEPADDWFFTLTGPDFRVVLIAVGRGRDAAGPKDVSVLRHPVLDEVDGETAVLEWLEAPPMPEARGYK